MAANPPSNSTPPNGQPPDDLNDPSEESKSPIATEVVVDTIAHDDESVPPEFRGSQVLERRLPDGSHAIFYKGEGGFTATEDQAKVLIQAYRMEVEAKAAAKPEREVGGVPGKVSAWETPVRGDMVVKALGYGSNVPEKLQGSRLIQREGTRFYLTLDGEAIPEEVGDALIEAWEMTGEHKLPPAGGATDPESAQPPIQHPVTDPQPRPFSREDEPTQASKPITASTEEILEVFGNDDPHLPPKLRGSRLVNRADGFFFITADGHAIPKEIGEDLMDAWEEEVKELGAEAAAAEPEFAPDPGQPEPEPPPEAEPEPEPPPQAAPEPEPEPEPEPPPKAEPEPEPQPRPEPEPPPQAEPEPPPKAEPEPQPRPEPEPPPQTEAEPAPEPQPEPPPKAEPEPAPEPKPEPPPKAEPEPEPAGDQKAARMLGLKMELESQAELFRRDLGTGVINLEELAPTSSEMEQAVWSGLENPTGQTHLDRLVTRSLNIRARLLQDWADSEDRQQKAWYQDLNRGTLVLAAVNPVQLKDLEVDTLVSLTHLKADPERHRRRMQNLAKDLRKRALTSLTDAIRHTGSVEAMTQAGMSAATEGQAPSDGLQEWIWQQLQEGLMACLEDLHVEEGLALYVLADALKPHFEGVFVTLGGQYT